MLDFDIAQDRFIQTAPRPSRTELARLVTARGRVLAKPVVATIDLPPANLSAMDGYALYHADTETGAALPVVQCCYAGEVPQPIERGQAMRLFTGSRVPDGVDTVVAQEDVSETLGKISLLKPARFGQNIRKQGHDVERGQVVIRPGTVIQPAHIGLAAMQGMTVLDVFSKPKVGILTTGSELVAPGTLRTPEQVFNSNAPMLTALVEGLGAEVSCLRHTPDNVDYIRVSLSEMRSQCDLILTVGGASVGEKDLIQPVIRSLGGEFLFSKVNMKPGKPVSLAFFGNAPIACLPGNPGAALATFVLFVSPMLRRMQGRTDVCPPLEHARLLTEAARGISARDEFLRVARRRNAAGEPELVAAAEQGAGSLASITAATGLARVHAGHRLHDGAVCSYYDFQAWLV